ncbi:hypothetical protein BH23BAC4_BH23BAC4_17620 [soil metagenome]
MEEATTQHSTVSEAAPDPGGSGAACCLNCGAALSGPFCAKCGQRGEGLRLPLHRFARESFVELFGVDGRIWRTLGILLFLPGRLTANYVAGKRGQYVRPVRVYLAASLAFFFVVTLIDPVGRVRPAYFISDLPSEGTLHPVPVTERLATVTYELQTTQTYKARYQARLDSLPTPAIIGFISSLDSLELALSVERAQLAEAPGDSIVEPQVHTTTAHLISTSAPVSQVDVRLPAWLPQSPAVRRVQQAQTVPELMAAAQELARSTIKRVATMMFIMVPIFAAMLKLLYIRRDWYYAEHLVFALHVHAFMFVILGICITWATLAPPGSSGWVLGTLLTLIPVYFLIAQRIVYRQGLIKGLMKAAIAWWFYTTLLSLGVFAALAVAAAWG